MVEDQVVISPEDPGRPEARAMLLAGENYFASLYPPEHNYLLEVASLRRRNVRFFVARAAGRAIGTGAVVFHEAGYAEIKRMWVETNARGNGVGRRVLQELEKTALAHGFRVIRLETGIKQPQALKLYRAAGYREIEAFGDYAPSALSVFMEKRLGPDLR
ncbi:MAG TPA: GNAT family N-acetyltransferase [Candidatus Binataceae bacterium]|nr:GNAT family N-acetyltransferase [Candidatus Binataceae bacterium]